MNTFDHFAYGSNLSLARIRQRCPSAEVVATGFVRGRRLQFHKIGLDGTGKADACWTGNQADRVWGVIYRCGLLDRDRLDQCESLGVGYDFVPAEIHVGAQRVSSFLYQARHDMINAALAPADWYLGHCVAGAREHRLPVDYQRQIQAFESVVRVVDAG